MRKVAYVAEDQAPRATPEPLAAALPGSWLTEASARALRGRAACFILEFAANQDIGAFG